MSYNNLFSPFRLQGERTRILQLRHLEFPHEHPFAEEHDTCYWDRCQLVNWHKKINPRIRIATGQI